MADQLRALDPPAVLVVDGEVAITALVEPVWPDVPIQRCWWHCCAGWPAGTSPTPRR
jgi:hypothetical protein